MMFEALQKRVISSTSLNSLKFGGSGENPYEWLSQIDRFFTLRNLPDEQRLSFVFYHLEGEALAWFQWLEMNCLLTSWSGFLQLFKSRFGSKFDDPLTRLLNLPQMRSVRDYQTEIEDKASHVTKVPEAILDSELLSRKGLQPTTLTEAFDVVYRALERNYQDNRTKVQEKSQGESDQGESDVHDDLISKVVHNPPALVEVPLNPWFLIQVYPKLDAVSPYHHYHLVHGTPHLLLSLPKGHKSFNSREDAEVTSRDMLGHWGQDEFLGVARRLFIFSLYALEEVYKDLILHLEDKVVLKG